MLLQLVNQDLGYDRGLVLHDISISIHEGDRIALVGESGAVGPSTEKFVKEIFALLSQLSGPLPPVIISAVVIALAALVVFLSGRAYFLLKGTRTGHPNGPGGAPADEWPFSV